MRCSSRAPKTPLPAGLTVESARTHPLWKYALEPTAQCDLDQGHGDGTPDHDPERRHRNGLLLWWDPVVIYVDGDPHVAPTDEFVLPSLRAAP